ncbi:hypothetical protein LSH36_188g09071 [Paralvinella palmiformis]|uniref:SHQ1-like CS domain-containing protein n=1 Tax=Paralvinella palmiformis TaxID=53620 RepID=A0AAD9JR11_9ANNE|nr:hypothetical protein LSH36_188g09071 [Paralvinella palmiformis]
MLTPSFQLSQSDLYLTVLIRTPFAKISETEVFVDGTEFKFYSKPYYLRLNLPGEVVEDGRESAKYDSDSDLPEADKTPEKQRCSLRLTDEQQHFSEEHYLSDLYANEMISDILAYSPPCCIHRRREGSDEKATKN